MRWMIWMLLAGPVLGLELRLPTDNDALLRGAGPEFFQVVDRLFEGVQSTPWEGGQFGFVRDAKRLGDRIAYARFHEGLDIRPLQRDARGDPLDEVRAILPGEVVHVSASPSRSNYGRYVVLRHDLPQGPLYSLYAHLARISVQNGQRLDAGSGLGLMGYSGSGINQRRAHVHVELNMLLSPSYANWHQAQFQSPNHHGIYNGINLLGLDLQRLYLEAKANPALDLAQFWRATEVYFEVELPRAMTPDFAQRHPFLLSGSRDQEAGSWLLRCSRWGLPVELRAMPALVTSPRVSWTKSDPLPHGLNSRGLLTNSGLLSREGKRWLDLLLGKP